MRKRIIAITIVLVLWGVSFYVIGEHSSWDCPGCGRTGNTGNYCGGCGCPAPSNEENQAAIKKEPSYYAITWQDDTGKTIDITTVEYGEKPTHADPKKEADQQYVYTFSGWQPHLENVTGDATYKATFRKMARTYTVTWLDESGKLIDTTSVAYGYKPTHKEPTKESDQQYTYTFSGWQPAVEKVTRDATYKATFKKEKRLNTGDIITFGHYEQDNNMKNGPEPIEWIVLDVQDGRYMVLSKYILDAGNHKWYKVSAGYLYIYNWLNDVFLNTAFTVEDRKR